MPPSTFVGSVIATFLYDFLNGREADELQEPERFGAWLGRIVRNLALDARRAQPKAEIRGAIDEFDPPHECDPSREAEDRETAQRIDKALATLDDQTRSAVVLRYYQNLSSRQIGEILEMSPARGLGVPESSLVS